MEKDANGNIALVYYQPTQRLVRMGDRTEYVFVTQANICLCWVQEKHVAAFFAMKRHCCGGEGKTMFRYASETEVRRWTNRGGR